MQPQLSKSLKQDINKTREAFLVQVMGHLQDLVASAGGAPTLPDATARQINRCVSILNVRDLSLRDTYGFLM
jgi:hypothetical protein